MAATRQQERASDLINRLGQTYAEQAGIRLADRPAPLYQLLVLAGLLSAPISAEVAVAAASELFRSGYRTPEKMLRATWQQRVDALGRGHYRRFDERTATQLGRGARLLIDNWGGDLRRLRDEGNGEARRIRALLTLFPGIGPTGADIFLREVQVVWPEVAPFADERVSAAAKSSGLPSSPRGLRRLVGSDRDLARLESGLVRRGLGRRQRGKK